MTPNRLPFPWTLIMQYFLNGFITDNLVLNEHYFLAYVRINQRETKVDFAERLNDMAYCCWNVFSNAEL